MTMKILNTHYGTWFFIIEMLAMNSICTGRNTTHTSFLVTENITEGDLKASNSSTTQIDYCNEDVFKGYINHLKARNESVPEDVRKYMVKNCDNKLCAKSKAYGFFTYHSDKREYYIGIHSALRSDECWFYVYELISLKTKKTIIRLFNNYSDLNQSTLLRPFRYSIKKFYMDTFSLKFTIYPSGEVKEVTFPLPKNDCQYKVIQMTSDFYFKNFDDKDCPYYFSVENLQGISEEFCKYFSNPTNSYEIKDNLNKVLSKRYCTVYTDFSYFKEKKNQRYLWLALSFVTMLILTAIAYKCYMARKKQRNRLSLKSTNKIEAPKITLPTDSNISVMILHRPGCEVLDSFVRDLSYIIQSYGFDVFSPLLEMSQIEQDGGIATYIQRNVDLCTYILILVSDNETEVVHRTHKPFDFSIKLLSGLAFRNNECSRYIPVYFKDYNEVAKKIPSFLHVKSNCGYRIPNQIKELIMFMKQISVLVEDKDISKKVNFFVEKLKLQVKNIQSRNHKGCCKSQCKQGMVREDVSELWKTEISVTTKQTRHEETRSILSGISNFHQQPLTFDDNGDTTETDTLLMKEQLEEKVKCWQKNLPVYNSRSDDITEVYLDSDQSDDFNDNIDLNTYNVDQSILTTLE